MSVKNLMVRMNNLLEELNYEYVEGEGDRYKGEE